MVNYEVIVDALLTHLPDYQKLPRKEANIVNIEDLLYGSSYAMLSACRIHSTPSFQSVLTGRTH